MDLLKPLIDAVLAGAAAGASGVATEAVTSAYAAVKDRIGARLTNWSQIERKPDSPAYRAAAEEELADHRDLVGDTELLARVNALQEALSTLPAFFPVLRELEGDTGLRELHRAIADTAAWYP
jgi:hypothetical protein